MIQTVNNPPAKKETWVQSLGWEDSLENEIATHSSILAWRIPWIEDPCRLPSTGSQRVRHDWIISTFSFHTLIWDHFWVNYMLPILLMGRLFTVCQFSSVQSLSRVQLFATPWTVAHQASSVHGIFQARILEWVAIYFSRESSQPKDWTHVSCIGRQIL